jgi:hypothetical protein
MGKYGEVALRATELLRHGRATAEDAWRVVAAEMFADTPAARAKVCPRETFLGLCQAGLLAGVRSDRCEKVESGRNRLYATAAVELLKVHPHLADDKKAAFWRHVLTECGADPDKKANSQMDVVLTLWNRQLIDASRIP